MVKSNPGILKFLLMKMGEISVLFAFQSQLLATFINYCILPIWHVFIRHYYIRDCETWTLIETSTLCWVYQESETDIYSFTRARFLRAWYRICNKSCFWKKVGFSQVHPTRQLFYSNWKREYSELFFSNFSRSWTNKGIFESF